MNKKEQWVLLQKMGNLLDASLSLDEVLKISAKSIKSKKLLSEVERIQEKILEGKSLYEAMILNSSWKKTTTALIYAGEFSGMLSSNLLRAATSIKLQYEQNNRLLSAILYPAIISVLSFGIIIFLLSYVYPKIIPMFIGMKMALPLSTRIMIQISYIIQNYWLWIFGTALILIFLCVYAISEREEVRLFAEHALVRIPIIGKLLIFSQYHEISFLCSSFLAGGMNLPDAIKIAGGSAYFLSFRRKLERIFKDIQSGLSFSECILVSQDFPSIWGDLVTVGERTESLSSVLLNISQIHRQEIDDLMGNVNKLIEPLMMIAVGAIVGFIALSIITPMYSLTQQVHG